jgi:hypothetical protein
MRGVLVRVALMSVAAVACSDSCPLPAANTTGCVEGGLEGVSLPGDWTLVGTTQEAFGSGMPSGPQDITRTIHFDGGCGFGGEDFADGECGIDDDAAACKYENEPGRHEYLRALVVCKNDQGQITYRLSSTEYRSNAPLHTWTTGVLSR